jgi:Flp pilus assembly protein TadD
MTKKFLSAVTVCLLWSGLAWGHTDIEGLPDSVAIMAYKQIIYLNPADLGARNKLAMAHCRRGEMDEAKKELEYILNKDKQNFDALDGMGVVLLKTGQLKDAVAYFERAVKINDKDALVYVHLSAAFHKMKMADEAKEQWKKAQSLASTGEEKKKLTEELKWVAGK